MRFQTTRCREYGAPELSFEVDDPALYSQAERWVSRIESRAQAGERWIVEQLFVLDGWPALLVARGELLELHAQDLSRPSDAAPEYAAGMTGFARLSAEQWKEAESYGAAAEFAPPDYIESMSVCPQLEKTTGSFVMQRSRPVMGGLSGWVVQCGDYCIMSEGPGGLHVPASLWREVAVFELLRMRPALVRYLALPIGFRLERALSGSLRVVRWRSDTTPPRERNEAMLQFPRLPTEFVAVESTQTTTDAAEPDRVALDFARDADVWAGEFNPTRQRAIVRERHGVSDATAARTVAHYMTPAMLCERVRWRFRDALPSEHLALAEARLRAGGADAWKAAHGAAMALRAATGQPFAPLMKVVQRLQARLAEAESGRVESRYDGEL